MTRKALHHQPLSTWSGWLFWTPPEAPRQQITQTTWIFLNMPGSSWLLCFLILQWFCLKCFQWPLSTLFFTLVWLHSRKAPLTYLQDTTELSPAPEKLSQATCSYSGLDFFLFIYQFIIFKELIFLPLAFQLPANSNYIFFISMHPAVFWTLINVWLHLCTSTVSKHINNKVNQER